MCIFYCTAHRPQNHVIVRVSDVIMTYDTPNPFTPLGYLPNDTKIKSWYQNPLNTPCMAPGLIAATLRTSRPTFLSFSIIFTLPKVPKGHDTRHDNTMAALLCTTAMLAATGVLATRDMATSQGDSSSEVIAPREILTNTSCICININKHAAPLDPCGKLKLC